ncbi:MAG: phosphoribosyltransferase [Elusimicrobiota bacterium]|jgi:hypoxanthine phosphoribosyltransferase|nr:phosphoribosyltransferase [Elusimicrobiota bacterium]
MIKTFLTYDEVRNNAIKLADKIFKDGFFPDVIYVSLRGGAYLGNVISEYFKIICKNTQPPRRPVYYAAVVARSYGDIGHSQKVSVDGWTYSPDYLRIGDKVLLVDDIFDSGQTLNYLANIILDKGIPRSDLKIAVHDYKYFYDLKDQQPIQPDYWSRRHDLSIHQEPTWIHYLSHELVGLTTREIEKYYYSQDDALRDPMSIIEK